VQQYPERVYTFDFTGKVPQAAHLITARRKSPKKVKKYF
jgi:hypothetical protein